MNNRSTNSQHANVPFGINFIRKGVLILAIIITASLILQLPISFSFLNIEDCLRAGLMCAILWIIFCGIKQVKSWTVILVLLFSYFAFLSTTLETLNSNVVNGYDILKKLFHLILLFFYAFQIVIFSRLDTKRYFKEKGTVILS
jgi:hypothetical protein